MKGISYIFHLTAASLILIMYSCDRISELELQLDELESRIAAIENSVTAVNDNAVALSNLLKDDIAIIGIKSTETGYEVELSDGTALKITEGHKIPAQVPVIGVDSEGHWIISLDGGKTFEQIPTTDPTPDSAKTPQVRVNKDGYWEFSTNGGWSWSLVKQGGKPISAVDGKEVAGMKSYFSEIEYSEGDDYAIFTLADGRILQIPVVRSFYVDILGYAAKENICLDETRRYEIRSAGVAEAAINAPSGWHVTMTDEEFIVTAPSEGVEGTYEISFVIVSTQGFVKNIKTEFTLSPYHLDSTACKEWNDFNSGNEDNVLVDYSYAGYARGEKAPVDINTLGYTVYDVTSYGAVPNDGLSDREAFLEALKAALKVEATIDDNNCISFAHKEKADAIIYFPEGEFILHSSEDDQEGVSQGILIRSGNFVIKGAGRDKTSLVMTDPMLPVNESVLYSSPDMIQIKHNSGISSFTIPAAVTEDSGKGSFRVTVASSIEISAGDWVCLYVKNKDMVAKELGSYTAGADWDIALNGIEVIDIHQVKEVDGNTIIFHEPLLHEVCASEEWEVMKYPHYENVGVEDLTFKGNAKSGFVHHGSWEDDGAFKPLSMTRLVNSWIRRVGFESTSEGCSIISSANVSAYEIVFSGNRGHAAVRSQGSSRVLIAATDDRCSDGGNFHGVGVSRHSIGTVLWRNTWGDDSCFESHATQPRATLIDCCSGGWHRGHQGGDSNQAPHHLADLTIWNFTATSTSESGLFHWWGDEAWWKFLPPVIVGFQSETPLEFDPEQTTIVSTHGMAASPESLYEAQLRRRLGSVPAWLNTLKRR